MAVSAEENKGRLLSSWKEIAEYLKCDVRTCLRWEQTRGLPIHRLEGTPKSRVFAYQDELDSWVKGRNGAGESLSEESVPATVAGFRLKYLFFAIAVLTVGTLIYLFFLRPSSPILEPFDFHIDGSELIILAKSGKELWRYDSKIENLCDEAAFRIHFQIKKPDPTGVSVDLPWIMIKDINRDQKPEVLFSPRASDRRGVSDLLCFNNRGKELWRFKAGREMWCGSRPYSSEYYIRGFDAVDIDNDGNLETVIISQQPPNWLTQLAVLDTNGRVLGEFWNSGNLGDFFLADLNGDGKRELLTVGLNNEYAKGCLVVFDPSDIGGGSPQTNPEFTCRDMKAGTEKYYLLFPRTDVDLATYPMEAITKLYVENPQILSLTANLSELIFVLNFDLVVEDITISHNFMQKHKEALLAGKIHSDLYDPRYKEALMKGILYYDGKGWTARPGPVVHAPQ
jgi:hypothetical protein